MDLPTYTNIWRIEKRLYKLYDLRLPMPLPLVQIGVFIGVFVPWIVLLRVVGIPFHAPWHVFYIVPPLVLTWLATRPVIEGKRLTELLLSQTRYLVEPRTWCRLTPIREPREVVVTVKVWRSGVAPVRTADSAAVMGPEVSKAAGRAKRSRKARRAEEVAVGVQAKAAARTAAAALALRPAHVAEPQSLAERLDAQEAAGTLPSPSVQAALAARHAVPTAGPAPLSDREPVFAEDPHIDRPADFQEPGAPVEPAGWRSMAKWPPPAPKGRAEVESVEAPEVEPVLPVEPPPATPRLEMPVREPVVREQVREHAAEGSGKRGIASGVRRPGGAAGFWEAIAPVETVAGGGSDKSDADGKGVDSDREPESEPVRTEGTAEPVTAETPAEPAEAAEQPKAPAATVPDIPVVAPAKPTRPDIPMVPGAFGGAGRGPAARPPAERPPSAAEPPAAQSHAAGAAGPPPQVEEVPAKEIPLPPPVDLTKPGEPLREVRDALVWPPPGQRRRLPRHAAATPSPAGQTAEGQTVRQPPPAPPLQPQPGPQPPAPQPSVGDKSPTRSSAGSGPQVPRPFVGSESSAGSPSAGDEMEAEQPSGQSAPPQRPAAQETAAQPPASPDRTVEDRPAEAPNAPVPPVRPMTNPKPWPPQPHSVPKAVPPRPQGTPYKPPPPTPVPDEQPRPAAAEAPAERRKPAVPAARNETPEFGIHEGPAAPVRSGPASPVRPRPRPLTPPEPPPAPQSTITPPDVEQEGTAGGLRRLMHAVGGGSGQVDAEYEERLQRPFQGTRRIVVLGCTGGAGQTVTGLMLGHTFAQYCGEPVVAIDVNPGTGSLSRRTRSETPETLTGLIARADQVHSLTAMRRYTSSAKSGLDVIAAGKNPLQALDDRDYALAIRTLDRFYSITLLDAAAAIVARVLPYADQIVLVAPASADAPRAVGMTFEWLDGHGYDELRSRAVTVINGVSRRSLEDVEQAEAVARGRCRALVRIPWDDHLSLDRAPRNELKSLRAPTRRAYLALAGVVAGGFAALPERYQQDQDQTWEQEVGR